MRYLVVFTDGSYRYEPNLLEVAISEGHDDFLVVIDLEEDRG